MRRGPEFTGVNVQTPEPVTPPMAWAVVLKYRTKAESRNEMQYPAPIEYLMPEVS